MISFGKKKKDMVLVPEEIIAGHFVGDVYGRYCDETGVFNIFSKAMKETLPGHILLGRIYDDEGYVAEENLNKQLYGVWNGNDLFFYKNDETTPLTMKAYNLIQNIFSRNTGILEPNTMNDKCVFLLGCGSVGSLIALELARAGVGKFVLIDNDIVEYHNLCRHQCSISDVGEYKVHAVAKRIREINPAADIKVFPRIVEEVSREVFDEYCVSGKAVLIGCADNRSADVYANTIAISYGVPFISIGFWERAFAGEIFYHLPGSDMVCYECALGDGGDLSQRQSTNRRFYTNEEDLANTNFEPGISVDINFVTTIGVKLALDIINIGSKSYTPRLLGHLKQYTLVCNTNNPKIGGEMAEIFSYPLQVTTSLKVNSRKGCRNCCLGLETVIAN